MFLKIVVILASVIILYRFITKPATTLNLFFVVVILIAGTYYIVNYIENIGGV